MALARLGIFLGVVSILFSVFCLIVMPVFGGAIIAAPLAGIPFGALAFALGARRTASVTFVFALVPACGLFVMEKFSEYFGTGYIAFAPLVVGIAVAAWALSTYSRTKRMQ